MGKLPSRDEMDDRYQWRLEDIYPNDEAWEEDFNTAKGLVSEGEKLSGSILSAKALEKVLNFRDMISEKAEKLFTYARMRRDEDSALSKYQALADRGMGLMVEVNSGLSFIEPEILTLTKEQILGFLEECDDLKIYAHYLKDLLRKKDHILDPHIEKVLAQASEMAEAPDEIYSMLENADIKFPYIKDEKGEDVELTKGRFIGFMESRDRNVRKSAFEALYTTYQGLINTMGAATQANVKKNIFYKNQRKFPSSLEASLFGDNVSPRVYDSLIESVRERMDLMHRYVKLRKRVLGLDELHMYDLYVPLVPNFDKSFKYEEAQALVLEGLKPLGEDYGKVLKSGFDSGWVDVYENRGKRGGAYSWGTYGTHPYVLLNFQGRLDDVFTLAHEMGHALHSHYSYTHQPYANAHYPIFLAEVASTCNEALLIAHLLGKVTEKTERLFLLNHYMDQFKGTVYRQVMFAEFEKMTHEMAEKGIPLNAEILQTEYFELNEQYYGSDIVADPLIAYEWARIPHFYSSFYVYKYATGFSAAVAIAQRILKDGKSSVEPYLEFLKSGDSDYPLELLKKVGVDLTTPEPVLNALKVFEGLLDEFEATL